MSTDDAEASEPTPAEAPATPSSRPAALVLAVSLAVVFAITAAVLGVVALGGGDDDGEAGALRRAAGEAAEAFFTYDHSDLDGHRERMLALSTGSFRKEYDESFDEGLGAMITRVQASSRGFVKDVYLSDVQDERGEAVVVTDVENDGVAGPQTMYDLYLILSFVRVDGTWKLDDVTNLELQQGLAPTGGADGAADGTSSTSTPVP